MPFRDRDAEGRRNLLPRIGNFFKNGEGGGVDLSSFPKLVLWVSVTEVQDVVENAGGVPLCPLPFFLWLLGAERKERRMPVDYKSRTLGGGRGRLESIVHKKEEEEKEEEIPFYFLSSFCV